MTEPTPDKKASANQSSALRGVEPAFEEADSNLRTLINSPEELESGQDLLNAIEPIVTLMLKSDRVVWQNVLKPQFQEWAQLKLRGVNDQLIELTKKIETFQALNDSDPVPEVMLTQQAHLKKLGDLIYDLQRELPNSIDRRHSQPQNTQLHSSSTFSNPEAQQSAGDQPAAARSRGSRKSSAATANTFTVSFETAQEAATSLTGAQHIVLCRSNRAHVAALVLAVIASAEQQGQTFGGSKEVCDFADKKINAAYEKITKLSAAASKLASSDEDLKSKGRQEAIKLLNLPSLNNASDAQVLQAIKSTCDLYPNKGTNVEAGTLVNWVRRYNLADDKVAMDLLILAAPAAVAQWLVESYRAVEVYEKHFRPDSSETKRLHYFNTTLNSNREAFLSCEVRRGVAKRFLELTPHLPSSLESGQAVWQIKNYYFSDHPGLVVNRYYHSLDLEEARGGGLKENWRGSDSPNSLKVRVHTYYLNHQTPSAFQNTGCMVNRYENTINHPEEDYYYFGR